RQRAAECIEPRGIIVAPGDRERRTVTNEIKKAERTAARSHFPVKASRAAVTPDLRSQNNHVPRTERFRVVDPEPVIGTDAAIKFDGHDITQDEPEIAPLGFARAVPGFAGNLPGYLTEVEVALEN